MTKHDVAKVFARVSHRYMDYTARQMHQGEDADITLTRHRNTACAAQAYDGTGTHRKGAACLTGDAGAAAKFRP
eukprot:2587335-Pyramimonas_sp.AAC.1